MFVLVQHLGGWRASKGQVSLSLNFQSGKRRRREAERLTERPGSREGRAELG